MESKIVDTLFLCAVKLGSEDEEIPRQVMEPRWAMREGSEAAAHALSQPFTVPLVKDGKEVPGDIAPLGEYAPLTPVYNNPLAQFIPNVTWHANGDVVYGWDGKPADEATLRAIEDEEAKKEAAMDQERLEIAREQEAAGEIKNEIAQEGKPSLDEAVAAKEAEIEQTEKDLAAIEKPSVSEPAMLNGPGDSSKEMARLYAVLSSREKELAEKTAAATAVKEKIAALQATQGMVPGVVPEGEIVNQPQGPAAAPAVDVAGGWVSPVFKPSAQAQAGAVAGAVAAAKQSLPYGVAVGAPNPSGYILKPFFQLPAQ